MQVFRDIFREKVLSLRGSTSEPCPIGFVLTTGKDLSSHVSSRKLVKSEMEPPQENAHGIQFKKIAFPLELVCCCIVKLLQVVSLLRALFCSLAWVWLILTWRLQRLE